jgi:hypothetical protein
MNFIFHRVLMFEWLKSEYSILCNKGIYIMFKDRLSINWNCGFFYFYYIPKKCPCITHIDLCSDGISSWKWIFPVRYFLYHPLALEYHHRNDVHRYHPVPRTHNVREIK